MVYFQCAGCGTDCKKNQVEKHKTQCRRSDVFSCIDCSVEFLGSDFASHNRCISESQKYEAQNSSSLRVQQSKGDAKQEAWLSKIHQALQDCNLKPNSDKRVTNTLEKLPDYPNIPRKKTKLINFLKSSLKVYDNGVCEAVWNFLENAKGTEPPSYDSNTIGKRNGQVDDSNEIPATGVTSDLNEENLNSHGSAGKKKEKNKKKEMVEEASDEVETNVKIKKIKKKKKDLEIQSTNVVVDSIELTIAKKKKKRGPKLMNGENKPPNGKEVAIKENTIKKSRKQKENTFSNPKMDVIPLKKRKGGDGQDEELNSPPKKKAKREREASDADDIAAAAGEKPKAKEERKLQKKLRRKNRRFEEGSSQDPGKTLKIEVESKVVNGYETSVKEKSEKRVSFGSVQVSEIKKKKKKGPRFDFGRVIHSFLDACPSKKASFAQVTSRVLEEFNSVKKDVPINEDTIKKKITKKIEFNPNITIKNGEILLA